MELVASNIQVLLQAAEYLERRERDAEHGYASLSPSCGQSPFQAHRRSRRPRPRPRKALKDLRHHRTLDIQDQKWIQKYFQAAQLCFQRECNPIQHKLSVHNELEKHRRAQLRQCLDQLKQQVPISRDHAHYTTLSLLHQARLHIKKLEERDQRAQKLKERLRCEQQNLHQRLEELMAHSTVERPRADSLDSSRFSSEHSESEDVEVDVEGLPVSSSSKEDAMTAFSTGQEHSYSNISNFWI